LNVVLPNSWFHAHDSQQLLTLLVCKLSQVPLTFFDLAQLKNKLKKKEQKQKKIIKKVVYTGVRTVHGGGFVIKLVRPVRDAKGLNGSSVPKFQESRDPNASQLLREGVGTIGAH
jgi:hypothetical protein